VIVLSDQALATRFEAWEMPDLSKLVPRISVPNFSPRGPNYKPYENVADGIAHHAPPGTPMVDNKYPVVTGLEHDEAGHPASRPANHIMMVAKRRRKLQVLASRLPKAQAYGSDPKATCCWLAGVRRKVRSAKRWTRPVRRVKASVD
jgi:2-oxoglutarate ferredoxin oxidoreductase subunit alpha